MLGAALVVLRINTIGMKQAELELRLGMPAVATIPLDQSAQP